DDGPRERAGRRPGRQRRQAAESGRLGRQKEKAEGQGLVMCGIIGYIGSKEVVPVLIEGLRRLEYRGYDSAGVAVVHNGAIELRRSAGKLSNLEQVIRI